jgi:hypothetical protein
MRKFNVFGKKISQVRPFYLLVLVFILLIPGHFTLNYFQNQKLDELTLKQENLNRQINNILNSDYDLQINRTDLGKIYAGFKNQYFDYYLETDILLYLDLASLGSDDTNRVTITDNAKNPLSISLPEDIKAKKINLEVVADESDQIFDFINLLLEQEQLFYIEFVNVNLLDDLTYHVTMEIYVFYLS